MALERLLENFRSDNISQGPASNPSGSRKPGVSPHLLLLVIGESYSLHKVLVDQGTYSTRYQEGCWEPYSKCIEKSYFSHNLFIYQAR